MNTIEETVRYVQSCKDTRMKPIDAVAVSFGVNWTQKQPPEVVYKKKLFLKISQFSQENTCVGAPF